MPTKPPPNRLHANLDDLPPGVQKMHFSSLDEQQHEDDAAQDPLPDSRYETAHRRAERLEKSIRNSEKARAQHEKDQILRLLDGLRGHDWLRVMGVSGVTETKKKEYEPARDYFIKGCETITDKFKHWNKEEKRRKLEKDRAALIAAEKEQDRIESDADPPDYSDFDASAARQLHEEAIARCTTATSARVAEKTLKMELVEKEFVSFYAKPHLRVAAIGKHRRSGRNISAFGQPLPEVYHQEFVLPDNIIDEGSAPGCRVRDVRRGSCQSGGLG